MPHTVVQELRQIAIQAAMESGQIDDIEKAISILKQAAEMQTAEENSANQPRLLRYEVLKTWAALIVPFLSIAVLAVTIFIQAAQLKATREANEATEWRETVKNVLSQLNKQKSVVADPAVALALLEPYTSNSRFGKDARMLSIELLSRVTSSDRFRDYFFSHHIGEDQSDIQYLTDLDRELYNNLAEIDGELKKSSPPEILHLAHDAVADDIEFLTGKLCALYRVTARATDLRDVFLRNGDLSNIDLSNADLTGAKLQTVTLTNATLGGDVKFKDSHFVDSHWWEARMIAKPLLKVLMDSYYPYYDPELTYESPPQKQQYTDRVLRLCQKVGMECKPESLKYGTPPSPATKPEA